MSTRTAPMIDLNTVLRACEPRFTSVLGSVVAFRMSLLNAPVMVRIDPGDLEQVVSFFVTTAKDQPETCATFAIATTTTTLDDAAAKAADLPVGAYAVVTITMPGSSAQSDTIESIFDSCDAGEFDLFTACMTAKMWLGAIQCDSAPDDRTVYSILLPLATATQPAAQPVESTATDRVTVLVVDDDAMMRALLRHMLTLDGFRVVEAESGGQALALLEREKDVALLLSDVVMPDMNGCVLGSMVVKLRPDMPILYISGYMDDVAWRDTFEFQSHFLQKPFSQTELCQNIRSILGANAPEAPVKS